MASTGRIYHHLRCGHELIARSNNLVHLRAAPTLAVSKACSARGARQHPPCRSPKRHPRDCLRSSSLQDFVDLVKTPTLLQRGALNVLQLRGAPRTASPRTAPQDRCFRRNAAATLRSAAAASQPPAPAAACSRQRRTKHNAGAASNLGGNTEHQRCRRQDSGPTGYVYADSLNRTADATAGDASHRFQDDRFADLRRKTASTRC
eukprot:SAG31_NODE_1592_length_7813_cov_28.409386_3_plen_205_part_00